MPSSGWSASRGRQRFGAGWLAGVALAALGASAGCDAESGQAPPADAAAASGVSVRVVDGAEYREALRGHRGKVVLVDFWASWCAPCRQQFPHTVALHRELRERGFEVISVSLDDPDRMPVVLAFLQEQGARFDNLISRYGTGTQSGEEFDLRGDIPFYRLYDRSGELRYQLSARPEGLEKGEPVANLEQRVRELVAAE